jgi:hypothetical protein
LDRNKKSLINNETKNKQEPFRRVKEEEVDADLLKKMGKNSFKSKVK